MLDLLAIGGATLDRKYRLTGAPVLGSSNPAIVRAGPGGVARNIAENAARMGARVALASIVGADEAGRAILEALDRLGIDRAGVLIDEGRPTAEYVAVLDPSGELVIGLADMTILDAGLDRVIAAALPRAESARWVFADCNMPKAALARLISARRGASWRLALDAVSVAKAVRLPDDLVGVDLLALNRAEAVAGLREDRPPSDLAHTLVARGAKAAIVTLGAEGLVAAEGARLFAVPAEAARVVDVTGAGDAFLAGTLTGLLAGLGLEGAARRGARAAALTVASAESARADLGARLDGMEHAP